MSDCCLACYSVACCCVKEVEEVYKDARIRWDEIVVNKEEAKLSTLDQVSLNKMGFTISPPHFDYKSISYELFIYLYLYPLEDLIMDDSVDIKIYPEFSKQGRLHFHGILTVPDEKYGIIYTLLNGLQYHYKNNAQGILKVKIGTKVHIKRFKRVAQVKPEFYLHSEKEWNEYVTKEVTHTEKILEMKLPIDRLKYGALKIKVEKKFSINIV